MPILIIGLSDKYLTFVLLHCGCGFTQGSWPVVLISAFKYSSNLEGVLDFLVDCQLMQTILEHVRWNACDVHACVYVCVWCRSTMRSCVKKSSVLCLLKNKLQWCSASQIWWMALTEHYSQRTVTGLCCASLYLCACHCHNVCSQARWSVNVASSWPTVPTLLGLINKRRQQKFTLPSSLSAFIRIGHHSPVIYCRCPLRQLWTRRSYK